MPLLLNIGNTHTQSGTLSQGNITLLPLRETAELLRQPGQLTPTPDGLIIAACVVPAVRQALTRHFGPTIHFITPQHYPQIDFSPYDTSTLGADRIANAAAAFHLYRQAVIIVDCGTAITTEAVDSHATFRGGAILAGRAMQRRAMHALTAQLPLVPLTADLPSPLGHDTASAIRAGIDLALLGALDRILSDTRRQPGFDSAPAIIVGGDATFFIAHLPGLTPGPATLTLQGVALAQL